MSMPDFTSNMDVIEHVFGPMEGKRLLDIGCGRGRLLRALARRGAAVTGVDPSAQMIAKSSEMAPDAKLIQSGAEDLAFEDDSFDGAIIMNALHHVPGPIMQPALREALRVVRPGGAFLVIEPLARGGYQEVFAPIDDETEIRAHALEAVEALLDAGQAKRVFKVEYDTWLKEESVEAVLEAGIGVDPSRASRIEAVREEVARRFVEHAKPDPRGAGYLLDQPMIAILLHAA